MMTTFYMQILPLDNFLVAVCVGLWNEPLFSKDTAIYYVLENAAVPDIMLFLECLH